jgi:hypothetical protein
MSKMPEDRNRNSVLRQLAALQNMSTEELKEKWRDLYGTEPPEYRSTFFRKRLAYRIQELFYGSLSEKSHKKLLETAKNDPASGITGKGLKKKGNSSWQVLPGTRLIREWRGREHEVVATNKGFEYDGRHFRSLSAVAKKITGTKWNGLVFFGLKKK